MVLAGSWAVLGQKQREGRRKPQGTVGGKRHLHVLSTMHHPPTSNSTMRECEEEEIGPLLAGCSVRPTACPGSNLPRSSCPPVPQEVTIIVLAKSQGAGPGSEGRAGVPTAGGHSIRHAHPGGQRPALSRPSGRRATREQQPHERDNGGPQSFWGKLLSRRPARLEGEGGEEEHMGSQEMPRGQGAEGTGGKRDLEHQPQCSIVSEGGVQCTWAV